MEFLRSAMLQGYLAVSRLRDREDGQAMVEYALILFLVSVASIAVLTTLGGSVSTLFSKVNADF
jgi:Flp pilus assembly pilin Flp